MSEGWQEVIEEKIRQDINAAILEWRKEAYLSLDDWDEDNRLRVKMRIADYDEGFDSDMADLPRTLLIDLVREYLCSMLPSVSLDGTMTDEELLGAVPGSQWDDREKAKLTCGQTILRTLINYEASL